MGTVTTGAVLRLPSTAGGSANPPLSLAKIAGLDRRIWGMGRPVPLKSVSSLPWSSVAARYLLARGIFEQGGEGPLQALLVKLSIRQQAITGTK